MNDKVCFPTSTSSIFFPFPVAILPLSTLSSPSSCYSCAEHSLGLKWCQSSVTPAIWRHPCLSEPLEAVGWVMQPHTMSPALLEGGGGFPGCYLSPPSLGGWSLPGSFFILHGLSWAAFGHLRGASIFSQSASVSRAHGFWRESTRLLSHEGR